MTDPLLSTRAVHAGERQIEGAVAMPVFQSAIFSDPVGTPYQELRYIRLNTLPNQRAAGDKVAALCGAEAGLVCGSGMAAISAALLSALERGQRVLVVGGLYGGSHALLSRTLPRFGIEADFVGEDEADWQAALTDAHRVIYAESLTNPLLLVPDHERIVAFARAHDLVSVIDNTMASPVNFRPLALGYDLELHSATKYLNGHSDVVAGAVVGGAARLERVQGLLHHFGAPLDPHACSLLVRGMKTLGLRVPVQNSSALALARLMAQHPAVARVHHPGLLDHPQHHRAAALMSGAGGVFSATLRGGLEAAQRFVDGLRWFTWAPSFGGVESLITRPVATSHASVPAQERAKLGISDGLVRIAVGVEDQRDLLADVRQALDAL